jgi:O-antigen biosynthesis protein
MTLAAGNGGAPGVAVVVLNYNGGEYLPACLRALAATDYPAERLETMVVDNASTDGSPEMVERDFPAVRLLRSGGNLGFARGNNAGIRATKAEFVALINPDTEVEPGWLRPLVATMAEAPEIAAVCPKLLLYEDRLAICVDSETFVPRDAGMGADERKLGLRVYSVSARTVTGAEREIDFRGGFGGIETDADGREFRWTNGSGELGIVGREGDVVVTLELSAPRPDGERVTFGIGTEVETLDGGVAGAQLSREAVALPAGAWGGAGPVVQNAGSELLADGSSRDRGTLITGGSPYADWDGAPYEEARDVFSLCGAGVLLRRGPLLAAGGFDERMFMYYEDTDLAYRLRRRGGRVRYAPESVIRHHHAALAGEWSPFFLEQVTRNRIYVLLKHRAWPVAGRALLALGRDTAAAGLRWLRQALTAPRHSGPAFRQFWPRLKALAWLARTAPTLLRARRAEMELGGLSEEELTEWVVEV